jgi:hypothetical protein
LASAVVDGPSYLQFKNNAPRSVSMANVTTNHNCTQGKNASFILMGIVGFGFHPMKK